ncbi:MAG: DedA family protein [Chloroflexi bacterium]|nr:DedA family protein [Chloroflexota bacterium]
MAIESACIPLPSEIILPMAGWMVSRGLFDFWWAVIAGTIGCTVGSTVAYYVGAIGGRPALLRYGRYVFISPHDLDTADNWFAKYGDWAIFFSRLLPVVRTFISFPAGVSKMSLPRFLIYTTIGSFPWSLGLVYAGKVFGDNWVEIRGFLAKFDYVIVAVILVLVALYIYRHLKRSSVTAE